MLVASLAVDVLLPGLIRPTAVATYTLSTNIIALLQSSIVMWMVTHVDCDVTAEMPFSPRVARAG